MDWIFNNIKPQSPFTEDGWEGSSVENCLPSIFSKYLKIFHAIYQDLSITDKSPTWDEIDKANLPVIDESIPGHQAIKDLFLKSTVVYGSPPEDFPGQRIYWKDFCEKLGLEFHPNVNSTTFTKAFPSGSWPRMYVGPSAGFIDPIGFAKLYRIIHDNTISQKWYFYYNLLSTRDKRSDILYFANPIDFAKKYKRKLIIDIVNGPPNYWFPKDKSCVVYTDVDLTFTLVGCSDLLAEKILENKELETAEISFNSRIDYRSDTIN